MVTHVFDDEDDDELHEVSPLCSERKRPREQTRYDLAEQFERELNEARPHLQGFSFVAVLEKYIARLREADGPIHVEDTVDRWNRLLRFCSK
jgi:hypothetical protein